MIKKILLKFSIATIAFLALSAKASTSEAIKKFPFKYQNFCHQLRQIEPDDCKKNKIYIEAGDLCFKKLQEEGLAVQKKLSLLMNKNIGLTGQNNRFDSSEENYLLTQEATQYLIKVTEMATNEIHMYREFLYPPEDYESPMITGGNQAAYMMGQDCYGPHKLGLDELKRKFENELKKLKLATNNAMTKEVSSGGREGKLTNSAQTAIVSGVQANKVTTQTIPIKKVPGQSDITGTPENLKKEKKLP